MDYGCDVSNRYTGYLDSDHGNSMSTSMRKKKGKSKKKRKSPNKNPSENVNKNIETSATEPPIEIEENHQSLSNDNIHETNEEIEHVPIEIETNSTDCPKSSTSCESTTQSDTSRDEIKTNDEHADDETTITTVDMNINETKWSVICFEEEKNLMALQSQLNNDVETQQALNEPEIVFNEHRCIYPTIYFYNSNFGNGNRRMLDWHDSGRRSNNELGFKQRTKSYYNNDNGNKNQINGSHDGERKKKRQNRRRKNKSRTIETDNSHDASAETQSNDEKPAKDLQNTSTDTAPSTQSINNSEQINESNQREFYNSKNRYNRFKHGLPPRTFNRRRSDFVRNV